MSYIENKNTSGNSSCNANYDIDKKLNDLLRENVIHKYTKSEKRTFQELQNYTIKLEIENNELERKIENLKKEIFVSNQAALDLGIELEESIIRISSLQNELKMKDKTLKMAHSQMETDAIDRFVTENYEKNENSQILKSTKKNTKNKPKQVDTKIKESSEMLDLSLSNSSLNEVSIDYGLIHTMKKKKKNEQTLESNYNKLEEENTNLIDDLNLLAEEVKNLRSSIDEKDKIISILYQEVENLKNSTSDEELNSGTEIKQDLVNEVILETSLQHLENLESIKLSLVEFLNYYGIKEDFNNFNKFSSNSNSKFNKESTENTIEIRMKEIKYILVNLKKINIIFKTLFMEYSKDLINSFENEYMVNVNSKVELMQDKINCLANYFERITNFNE